MTPESVEFLADWQTVLSLLDPTERAVTVLYYKWGFDEAEIAEVLGADPDSVSRYLDGVHDAIHGVARRDLEPSCLKQ